MSLLLSTASGRAIILAAGAQTGVLPAFVGSGDLKPGAEMYMDVAYAYNLAYATALGNCADLVDQAGANPFTATFLSTGKVNVAAINAWVISKSVTQIRVKKLYDQSGHNRDASQATLAKMPILVVTHSGLGNTAGLPVMNFTKSAAMELVTASTGLSTTLGTFSIVARASSLNTVTAHGPVQLGSSSNGICHANNLFRLYAGTLIDEVVLGDNFHAYQTVFNGTSSFSFVDGVQRPNRAVGANAFNGSLTIGKWLNSYEGSIGSVRFDSTAWSAGDCTTENTNQRNLWFKNTKYEGYVASRCRRAYTAESTNISVQCRSAHFATDDITALKLLFGAASSGGTSSVTTASIEYPSGTFTQVTFLGATSLTLASSASDVFSDYINVAIPKGSLFWIRYLFQGTTSNVISYNIWQNTFLGEACELSTTATLTDKTMSGTITNAGTPSGCSKTVKAIIGVTANATVYFNGDSIMFGTADVEDTSASNTGYNGVVGFCARSVDALGLCFISNAVSGNTAQSMVTSVDHRMGKCSHILSQLSVNDVNFGRTYAQLVSDLGGSLLHAGPAVKIYQTTTTPISSLATVNPGWDRVVGQKSAGAGIDAARNSFISALRAGTTGIPRLTGYIDAANVLESSQGSDCWAEHTPAYTGDGIHPTQLAHTLVVNAQIFGALAIR